MSTRYNGVPNAYNTHRKTCDSVGVPYTSYSKMFNANDSSMNGTCNTYTYTPINSKTEMS